VGRIGLDSRSASIIPAIIGLAHGLGLSVVAEGVETETQLAALRSFNCDLAQGFLFSPSVSATDFCRLVGSEPLRAGDAPHRPPVDGRSGTMRTPQGRRTGRLEP
jgi:EAL domain-containing protein (putative c-di-GMP-specific phosphodiesterase class I)